MDKNEVKTVNDVISAIGNGIDEAKTVVVHNRDNATEWVDIDDDPVAKAAMKMSKVLATLGILVLDNWDEMKNHFSEDVQNQVVNVIALFDETLDQTESDEN